MFLCNAGDKGSNFALWAEYHHSTCAKRAFSVIDHRIWELHIEDYLQMVSAEQKEYAEVFDYSKITEREVSSQTIGRTILFFRSIIFVVCNPLAHCL